RHDGAARGADPAAHRRRLARRCCMPDLAQISALLHDSCKPLGRRICGAVIDVDDFITLSADEGGGDLGDQRGYILGLVAHGNNNGNAHRNWFRRRQINTLGLSWPAAGCYVRRLASASYGPDAPRATLLRRFSEGPASGTIAPSPRMANPRRRAANQYRTNIAPITPINAPATTSLGWCARSTRRLIAIRTAYTIMTT